MPDDFENTADIVDITNITVTKTTVGTVVTEEVILEDRLQRIRELRLQRLPLRVIGKEVGLSAERVRQLLPRVGIAPFRKTTDERRQEVIRIIRDLTDKFGRAPTYAEFRQNAHGDPQYLFGTWNAALQASGVPQRKSGQHIERPKHD